MDSVPMYEKDLLAIESELMRVADQVEPREGPSLKHRRTERHDVNPHQKKRRRYRETERSVSYDDD